MEPNNLVTWHELSDKSGDSYSPEIIPLAEEEVPLGVEAVAHLTQPGVTAAALEAVLVPEHVQGLQAENIICRVTFYGK